MRRHRLLLLTILLCLGLVSLPAQAAAPTVVDRYPSYQGQVSCDPVAKPGVLAFQDIIWRRYGGGDYGIVRACSIGGASEHKEGRAWDWKLNANDGGDRRKARRALTWLTATVDGEPAARARNFGIMYIIWNRQMWRGYDADRGWQPYTGSSPHTDHVHFSFTWNGATQQTVKWTGEIQPFDYGPCQHWIGEQARPWRSARTKPCPTPIKRPTAHNGYYTAQTGERVRRVARFFDVTGTQVREWNGFPDTGRVPLRVGQKIRVARP